MSGTDIQRKILLICGSSQTVINFRMGLIKTLLEKDFTVSVVALDGDYKDDIVAKGVEFFCVNVQNRSLNPFGMKKLQNQYLKIIRQVQPSIVFTFMLKPNIFGVSAAKKAGVKKIFSMVEGAGDVFIKKGLKWKIIRFVVCSMYRKSFQKTNKVFFLNNDDKSEFIARNLINDDKCEKIPGIGVDTEYFAYKPIKNYQTFLMIARMLKTKGIIEYCKAARIVKQRYPEAIFNYLGEEGTIKIADIQGYIDDESINYLGTTKDVRPYLEDSTALVLPSYREGMPMSIMEAESVGRGIITSNTIGCKDTVIEGYNGFLIECGDYKTMAEKIIWCIEHPQETVHFGLNSRKFSVDKFDKDKINEKILGVINAE